MNKYFKYTMIGKVVVLTGLLLLLAGLYAPELHKSYLIDSVGSKVVRLVKPSNHATGGTGFSVRAPSGASYTLTNSHVCRLAEAGVMHANIPGTSRFIILSVKEISKETDLCLLENVPGYSGIALGNSLSKKQGVAMIGHPLLEEKTFVRGDITNFETITLIFAINVQDAECEGFGGHNVDYSNNPYALFLGISSACYRDIYAARTTIPTYPGNSGSPVVNFWGNLVGVVFAGNNTTNWGYIVPRIDIETFIAPY